MGRKKALCLAGLCCGVALGLGRTAAALWPDRAGAQEETDTAPAEDPGWSFGGFSDGREGTSSDYQIEPGGEDAFLAEQGFTEEDLFFETAYRYSDSSNQVFCLSLYCDRLLTRGLGLIRKYEGGAYVDLEIFAFDGCMQYQGDASVGQFSVFSEYGLDGREIQILPEGETIEEYFEAAERDDVLFDYEDGALVHLYEGRPHGGVDRFYFSHSGDDVCRNGAYLLEVDHGWGVTLYRF